MKKIPVLLNFDNNNQIGYMEIDETKLPKTADYVFSIGYYAGNTMDEVESLCSVSVVSDENYMKYLSRERS